MSIRSASRQRILCAASAALMTLGLVTVVNAQNEPLDSRNWWMPSSDGTRENGKLAELMERKKVYVVASFTDSRTISDPSPTRSADVQRMVMDAFSVYKDLHVVPVPSQADFAVVVRATATTESGDRPPNLSLALDPSTAIAVDVIVLVPGSKRSDGTFRPRVVWESSVTNAQVEAQSAARSTVDGFLWDLSKMKEKANAKKK